MKSSKVGVGFKRSAAVAVVLSAIFASGRARAEALPGYVTEGLIAQWDALDNAATGLHVTKTNAWTDLISGRRFTFNADGKISILDDRLAFPGANTAYATLTAADTSAVFGPAATKTGATIELVLKANSTANAIPLQATSGVVFSRYNGMSILSNGTNRRKLNWAWDAVATNTFSVVWISQVSGDAYVNGELKSYSTAVDNWGASGNQAVLGCRQSKGNYPFNGSIYALRVYNRELDAADRLKNSQADVARFQNPVSDDKFRIASTVDFSLGSFEPDLGLNADFSSGRALTLTAERNWTNATETIATACTGWKLYDASGNQLDAGSEPTCSYVHPTPAAFRKLVWQLTTTQLRYMPVATPTFSVIGRSFAVTAPIDKLCEVPGRTLKARIFISTTGKADSYVAYGEAVSVENPSLDTPVQLLAKFADEDYGKTGYVKVAFDTYDAEGNLVGTQWTSAVSSAIDDAATYTWTGGGDGTSWSDSGNWSDDQGGEALGYPHQPNAKALFPAGTANVNFDETVTFGTLNVTNKDLNLVFTANDGVAVTCTTLYAGNSTTVKTRHGGRIEFNGVNLNVSGNTEFRPNPGNNFYLTGGSTVSVYKALLCVLKEEKTFYTATTLGVEDDSTLTVRNLLQLGGAGTLAISNATVNAATVYLNGLYKNGDTHGGGGRIRFYGSTPLLAVSTKMIAEDENYTGIFGADLEFFVPVGGYAAAPIQYAGATLFFKKPTSTYNYTGKGIRFAVRGESPLFGGANYGAWPLVSCSASTIDTSCLTLTTARSTVSEILALSDDAKTMTYTRYDPTSCLRVTGAPREFGTGGYGIQRGLASGAAQTLTAPASTSENLTCSGYEVYDVATDGTRTLAASGSTTSFDYTHGTKRREVVWQWTRPDVYVATTGEDGDDRGDVDHPLATIQAGIDKYDCAVVHVAPGRYKTTTPTAIAAGKLVEVRGEGTDPSAVIIEKTANATRAVTIAEALATVTNITITTGDRQLQGGVEMSAGLLTGCIVTHCSTDNNKYNGGGVNMTGGMVRGCVISNNVAMSSGGGGQRGGGIYMTGGLVENCRLIQNESTSGSGGHGGGINATAGTIRGCLIDRCSARATGFGICASDQWGYGSAVIENCTIVGNYHASSTSYGLVASRCTKLRNNIIFGNTNPNGTANMDAGFLGVAEYNCTIPGLIYGDGNISDPPVFEDYAAHDYRLQFCACVNAALWRNWMDAAFDYAGLRRVVGNVPDMGYLERPPSSGLVCTFATASSGTPDQANITLTSTVDGDTEGLVYYWRVIRADGTVYTKTGAGEANPVFQLGAGDYDVELYVTNGVGKDASSRIENAARVTASVVYVNENGTDAYPYKTLASGAHDLETAFDLLKSGGTAFLAPGTYVISDRLNLASGNGTRLIALEGPATTVIRAGYSTPFASTGLPVIQMSASDARVEGVTLVAGRKGTHYSGGEYWIHTGISMSAGILTNCVLRDMIQYPRTESAVVKLSGGTATDVLITSCSQEMSGGSPISGIALTQTGGTFERSVISNCWTSGTSSNVKNGGLIVVSGGNLRNSLIAQCTSSHSAPICITGGTMDNCTIVQNKNTETTAGFNHAGGLIAGGGTVRNVILSQNWSNKGNCVSNLYGSAVTYTLVDDRETFAGEGNRTGDPKFRKGAGKEWRLKSTSPALNAGLKLDWMTETSVDLGGTPRVRNKAPDMGCYEGDAAGLMLLVR